MAIYSNDDVLDELNDLSRLDHDAIEAYRASIDRLQSHAYRLQLGAFMRDHERHVSELAEQVRALGGVPDGGPGDTRMLTDGAVRGGANGDDISILHAMNTSEAVTNHCYQSALLRLQGHPLRALVARNREDERRHKTWIEAELRKQ